MDKPRTRQDRKEGATEGRKEGQKEAAVMHTEGKDSRSGKGEGRREGKKEKGADEAGKTSTELYQSFLSRFSVFSRTEVMLLC